MKLKLLIAMLLLPTLAFAAKAPAKPCSHCKHPARTCTTTNQCVHDTVLVAPKEDKSLGAALISGFGIRAGWRWQPECPTLATPHPGHVDPFFLGLEVRVPVYEQVSGFVTWDVDVAHKQIDFGDRHQTTVGLVWQPGRH